MVEELFFQSDDSLFPSPKTAPANASTSSACLPSLHGTSPSFRSPLRSIGLSRVRRPKERGDAPLISTRSSLSVTSAQRVFKSFRIPLNDLFSQLIIVDVEAKDPIRNSEVPGPWHDLLSLRFFGDKGPSRRDFGFSSSMIDLRQNIPVLTNTSALLHLSSASSFPPTFRII